MSECLNTDKRSKNLVLSKNKLGSKPDFENIKAHDIM